MSNRSSIVFNASFPFMWSTSVPTQPHIVQNGCSAIHASRTRFHARFHADGTSSHPAPRQPRLRALRARPTAHSHHSAPLPEGSRPWQWGHRVGGVIGIGGYPNRGGGPEHYLPAGRGASIHPLGDLPQGLRQADPPLGSPQRQDH